VASSWRKGPSKFNLIFFDDNIASQKQSFFLAFMLLEIVRGSVRGGRAHVCDSALSFSF